MFAYEFKVVCEKCEVIVIIVYFSQLRMRENEFYASKTPLFFIARSLSVRPGFG